MSHSHSDDGNPELSAGDIELGDVFDALRDATTAVNTMRLELRREMNIRRNYIIVAVVVALLLVAVLIGFFFTLRQLSDDRNNDRQAFCNVINDGRLRQRNVANALVEAGAAAAGGTRAGETPEDAAARQAEAARIRQEFLDRVNRELTFVECENFSPLSTPSDRESPPAS